MPVTRQNRFRRHGYSWHSPVNEIWHSESDTEDLELGALLPERSSLLKKWDDAKQWIAPSGDWEAGQSARRHLSKRSRSRTTKLDWSASPYTHSIKSKRRSATMRKYHRLRSRVCSKLTYSVKLVLMTIGLLQCASFIFVLLEDIFPDELDLVSGALWDSWLSSDVPNALWTDRLDKLTEDVQPVMCHSHNDYWRRQPLYQAIRTGCTGVEADIWFLNDELYVAHTAPGIREDRTLATLYLNPIMELLDHKNIVPDFLGPNDYDSTQRMGVFNTRPKQSLVLLIDFKNEPEEIWHRLVSLLTSFRDKNYLTYFNGSDIVNGPLTVVASGKAPFERIVENSTYRHIFYDAPLGNLDSLPIESFSSASNLDSLSSHSSSENVSDVLAANQDAMYSPFNSFYASVSFKRSIGWPYHSSVNQTQLMKIRRQIRTAHSMGLKVRYWSIPEWPIGLRDYLWRVLVREGVDYLSVNDIEDVRWKNWGPRKGGWGKKWWR